MFDIAVISRNQCELLLLINERKNTRTYTLSTHAQIWRAIEWRLIALKMNVTKFCSLSI